MIISAFRGPCRVKFAAAPAEMAGKYDTEDGHCAQECRGIQPVRMTGRRQLTAVTPADIRMLEHELGEENQPSLDRLKRRCATICGGTHVADRIQRCIV